MVEASMRGMRMVMDFWGACQHDGGILVAIAFVAASSSRHQEKLPLYLGFSSLQYQKRGKALLRALLETLLT